MRENEGMLLAREIIITIAIAAVLANFRIIV
jgi:hypothetical protein